MNDWVGTSWKMVVLEHRVSIPIPHMKWVNSKWTLVLGQTNPHMAAYYANMNGFNAW